jgi:hypothetical protein
MHVFSEVLGDLAQEADAPPQLKEDYATMLREMGHASHEERQSSTAERVALSEKENRSPEENARLSALTAKEERVTHAFEQYLLEGKAPSPELERPFARFKNWLKKIYRGVQGIGRGFRDQFGEDFQLSDNMRRVFDRMLASEDEVSKAQRAQELAQPFKEAMASMSPEQLVEYADASDRARDVAEQKMLGLITRADREETTDFMQSERERMIGQVESELDADPLYSALKSIQVAGPLGGEPLKLDRGALVKKYKKEFVNGLPRDLFAKEGGLSADDVAMQTGWEDGDSLVRALRASEPRSKKVESEVQKRMEDAYGPTVLDNGPWLAAQAMDVVHSPEAARKAVLELNAIRRAVKDMAKDVMSGDRAAFLKLKGDVAASRQGMREASRMTFDLKATAAAAREMISGKTVGDITAGEQGLAGVFLRTERTAARATADAFAKGDLFGAIAAKERQITNMELYRAARDVRPMLERAEEKLKASTSEDARAKLGKAGPEFRDAADAVLQSLGFSKLGEGQPKPSFEPLVQRAAADAQGLDFDVDAIRELIANPRPWASLTVDEARNVQDAVENVRVAARQASTLMIEGRRISKEALFAEMQQVASKRPAQPLKARDAALEKSNALSSFLQLVDSQLSTPETFVTMLDSHEKLGPFRRALLDPLVAARDKKTDLTREFLPKIIEAFKELPKELQEKKSEHIDLREDLPLPADLKQTFGEEPVSRAYLWMIALNMGNAGNKQRLLDGYGWTEHQAMAALDKHLGKADWDFVQKIWDTLEGLYPHIAEAHERDTGLRPGQVVATPVRTAHGEYAGGYFPAREDPRAKTGPVRQNAENIADMFNQEYRRPHVATGHAKARAVKADYFVNLSWSVVPGHLAQVIQDVSHREAVKQIAQVIMDRRFIDISQRHLGEQVAKQFVPWLQAVANESASSVPSELAGQERVLSYMRGRAARQLMGGNIASMFKHLFDPIGGAALGATTYRDTGMATLRALNPITFLKMRNFAIERSAELRARADHVTRELTEELKDIGRAREGAGVRGFRTLTRGAQETLGVLHETMDKFVSTQTWTAGFTQSMRESRAKGIPDAEAEPLAIKAGDDALRKVYPSGEISQMSSAMRNKGFLGTALMFFGFANKVWNLRRQLLDKTIMRVSSSEANFSSKAGAVAALAGGMLGAAVFGTMSQFTSGKGKKEDETQEEFITRSALTEPFSDTPILNKVAENAADLLVTGKRAELHLGGSMAASFVEDLWKKATKPHPDEGEHEKLLRYVEGLLTLSLAGSGATQIHRTGDYVRQLADGEANPRGALDVTSGLIYGKRENQPANPFSAAQKALGGE